MVKVELLEHLKTFTEAVTGDLLLPVQPPEEDETAETEETGAAGSETQQEGLFRPAAVYIPRLPEMRSYARKAPFITHEIVTGRDKLDADRSGARRVRSTAVARTCFCVYHQDEQEGVLALLGLMERVRIGLLERVVIGKQFKLELDGDGLQTLVYPLNPDQVARTPFYLGEMLTTWRLPPIERKVPYGKKGYSDT